ncbi:MAG TPA: hypothetical protein VEA15_03275 [Caulobacteraceae bacterium]|nr:hypothetical protein [Caulobacteraceae bacterium]
MAKISLLVAGAEDPLEFAATSQDQRRFLLAYDKARSGGGETFGKFAFRDPEGTGLTRTLYVDLSKVLWVVTEDEAAVREPAPAPSAKAKQ